MIMDKYFVGVKFDLTSKAYYFSTSIEDLKIGEQVICDTANGLEMGTVTTSLMPSAAYNSSLELKAVVRRPTSDDQSDYAIGLKEAEIAMEITRTEVRRLGLGMNLINASYALDGTRVTINYTSDNRVDFRELLRVLAPQLRCRIELHQIPSRDKAKMIGGLGVCGLPLCCSTFLNQFDGISISRAKNQMLTLNIPKLSGACGKLICCLLYEDDMYTEAKKDFPRIGSVIHDNGIDYTVETYNVLARTVKLSNNEGYEFIPLDDYNAMVRKSYHAATPTPTPTPSSSDPHHA
jgi:cell fate regulator YaaT (PSP1 superfamily)